MVRILRCGTLVTPKTEQIDAIITAAVIRFDKVQYEISYFYAGEYKTAWVNEEEIDIKNGAKSHIGFR